MFETRRQARAERLRHARLLLAAEKAISSHVLRHQGMHPAPAVVVALAFALYAIRLDEDEARDYLNAALAERGYPLLDEARTDEGEDD
ncbi:hypothetical protein [Streptomyces sp. NPDC052225]|uniref:hypothetical protein n=1 Tax=Streptomyces sp. NPDC052225 TaxID=3154949 RepID=UPI00341BC838